MSRNITEVNAFTNPVVVPVDGDAVNATSISQGAQPLSDRTLYLLSLLGGAIGGASPRNANNGFAGLNASAQLAAAQIPYGLASGVAQLDASSRLPAATVRKGIIDVQYVLNASNFAAGASYADVPGFTVTLSSAVSGDLLLIFATAFLTAPAGTWTALKLQENENGGAFADLSASTIITNTTAGQPNGMSCVTAKSITTTGAAIVKGQVESSAGTGSFNSNSNSLLVVQLRP